MKKVIFICTANINRSVMAEAIFTKYIKERNLTEKFLIDSAGTGNRYAGQRPFPTTQRFLNKMNIPHEWIRSRQVSIEDLKEFDYVIAMDHKNLENLEILMASENYRREVTLLLDFVPELKNKGVPDPSVTGDYKKAYDLIQSGCHNLLEHIMKNEPF